jgi:hypothetical protein
VRSDQLFMVFDVESVGLHGEGFAYGFVVVRADGAHFDSGWRACDPNDARGTADDRAWIAANLPMLPPEAHSPGAVREYFWERWEHWKAKGALLVADCAWPVEARFLAACIDDSLTDRKFAGPYPLHELASFMAAAGLDPMAEYPRLPGEERHHPLGDARQSARLLLQALSVGAE